MAWRKTLREERRKERVAAARTMAKDAAGRFAFRRMYLFGSTIAEGPLSAWSDLDLAVEGLPEEDFFGLLGYLVGRSPIEVDLKPMERMDADVREGIIRRGLVLYER